MKTILIIGGGLAGLSLGIALRRRGVPVTLHEAGHYPRHKVCGEFISGRGVKILDELALMEPIARSGACQARQAAFFFQRLRHASRPLPQPALCISRYVLDDLLAREFRRCGGVLHEVSRWTGGFGSGIVRATGRRLESESDGWRWFGLKAHARHVALTADLEMHFLRHCYVGMCRLGGDLVDVCGLFRSRNSMPDLRLTWPDLLRGPEGSTLRHRLQTAEFCEGSFCAVAGLSLSPQKASDAGECCIGDAVTMIAPLTGNGMSMAVESATLAAGPLEAYSSGSLSWEMAQTRIASRCDEVFARRLRWASWFQRLAFTDGINDLALGTLARIPALWRLCFQRTRC